SSFSESADAISTLSFFDGSLRSRQTEQRMRTQGERLLSETVYDIEGRGRIKMLPAPVAGETYGYVPRFSGSDVAGSATLAAYAQQTFDGITPPAISPTSIVGKYYSASSGAAAPESYVPDASGHPFSATEPVRDSTSRPRRVGGYGAALGLDSGRETQFRYGT